MQNEEEKTIYDEKMMSMGIIYIAKNISKSRMGKKMPQEVRNRMRKNERAAKTYAVVEPDGRVEVVKNLSRYCRENGLCSQHMSSVASGARKHHRRYMCKIIDTD